MRYSLFTISLHLQSLYIKSINKKARPKVSMYFQIQTKTILSYELKCAISTGYSAYLFQFSN